MARSKTDACNFEELEKRVAEGMPLLEYLERNVCKTVPVQQLVHGLRQCGFELSPRALEFLGRKHKRLLGSQVCEGALREHRSVEKQQRCEHAGIATMRTSIIRKRILNTRRQFKESYASGMYSSMGETLPNAVYKPPFNKWSLAPLKEIKNSHAKPM